MRDNELEVKLAELTVKTNRVAAREAKIAMEEGYKKLKATMETRYESLKSAYEVALIDLEEAELHLTNAKEKLEKNFD